METGQNYEDFAAMRDYNNNKTEETDGTGITFYDFCIRSTVINQNHLDEYCDFKTIEYMEDVIIKNDLTKPFADVVSEDPPESIIYNLEPAELAFVSKFANMNAPKMTVVAPMPIGANDTEVKYIGKIGNRKPKVLGLPHATFEHNGDVVRPDEDDADPNEYFVNSLPKEPRKNLTVVYTKNAIDNKKELTKMAANLAYVGSDSRDFPKLIIASQAQIDKYSDSWEKIVRNDDSVIYIIKNWDPKFTDNVEKQEAVKIAVRGAKKTQEVKCCNYINTDVICYNVGDIWLTNSTGKDRIVKAGAKYSELTKTVTCPCKESLFVLTNIVTDQGKMYRLTAKKSKLPDQEGPRAKFYKTKDIGQRVQKGKKRKNEENRIAYRLAQRPAKLLELQRDPNAKRIAKFFTHAVTNPQPDALYVESEVHRTLIGATSKDTNSLEWLQAVMDTLGSIIKKKLNYERGATRNANKKRKLKEFEAWTRKRKRKEVRIEVLNHEETKRYAKFYKRDLIHNRFERKRESQAPGRKQQWCRQEEFKDKPIGPIGDNGDDNETPVCPMSPQYAPDSPTYEG